MKQERLTNATVKEKQESWYSIKVRRDKMIENILHHDSLTKNVVEGDVEGYSYKERKELSYSRKAWRTKRLKTQRIKNNNDNVSRHEPEVK
ncbi:craniofacial development protein 2-like [Aphis craccivora]|uniref:Craniofacial development protein 2-like n=1 Tax=Aphis craccivora TaxID=307492 RepID=A0A6G0YKY7_APHCR|nr:craniofacial development protein 2-like [Aphis craccivora]